MGLAACLAEFSPRSSSDTSKRLLRLRLRLLWNSPIAGLRLCLKPLQRPPYIARGRSTDGNGSVHSRSLSLTGANCPCPLIRSPLARAFMWLNLELELHSAAILRAISRAIRGNWGRASSPPDPVRPTVNPQLKTDIPANLAYDDSLAKSTNSMDETVTNRIIEMVCVFWSTVDTGNLFPARILR